MFALSTVAANAAWQPGSLAIVQVGDGITALTSQSAPVRLIELSRVDGAATGAQYDVTYSGATGIVLTGTTSTDGGMHVNGVDAYLGGYQNLPWNSTSGSDRRVFRMNLLTGAITGQSELYAAIFTATIRASSSYGGDNFALATTQGVRTGVFGDSNTVNVSGSDTNVRYVGANHGRHAYSISTGGNQRVKEIGSSNILLDVTSENIIVAGHAMSKDGLTIYLASDSTSAGGLYRFTRPDTTMQFSVPGVRIYDSALRFVTLYETAGVHQVFATYKSGTTSWAYGFLNAQSALPSTLPDWTVIAPPNTNFLGLGVASSTNELSGTVQLLDWLGQVSGRQVQVTVCPAGSSSVVHSGFTNLGAGGAFSIALPSGFVAGNYDVYCNSTLFLKRKLGSVAISANGAAGLLFALANGDVDDSGEVDAADIDAVIAAFGSTTIGINEDADGSGEVDAADIDTVIANFGAADE